MIFLKDKVKIIKVEIIFYLLNKVFIQKKIESRKKRIELLKFKDNNLRFIECKCLLKIVQLINSKFGTVFFKCTWFLFCF